MRRWCLVAFLSYPQGLAHSIGYSHCELSIQEILDNFGKIVERFFDYMPKGVRKG